MVVGVAHGSGHPRRSMTLNPSCSWGGRACLVGAMQRPRVSPSIALMIVVKRLGGGGHIQQALVSFSLGNGPLCPETKLTHTHDVMTGYMFYY
jgi:hypothetical protein